MIGGIPDLLGSSPRAWGTRLKGNPVSATQRFIPTCVGNTGMAVSVTGAASVHPHVRGEHPSSLAVLRSSRGSSPRAWGTPYRARADVSSARFIPTCVGNTPGCRAALLIESVHPHVRGEHTARPLIIALGFGSSPRAWGTLACAPAPPAGHRFIPTCVGNTCPDGSARTHLAVHPHVRGEHSRPPGAFITKFGSSPRAWGTRPCTRDASSQGAVHPHVRGEHHKILPNTHTAAGSSPRAWGTPMTGVTVAFDVRFIPTCVGNTKARPSSAPPRSVHPHVRGEHSVMFSAPSSSSGSSPRAWGTPMELAWFPMTRRFIPTCVGNTGCLLRSAQTGPVHPHVRGEHAPLALPVMMMAGSSPRAWGTPVTAMSSSLPERFIPTCVGNTATTATASQISAVHPHVRGEHVAAALRNAQQSGSSPRAWGTHGAGLHQAVDDRFIPTCVGNTLTRHVMGHGATVHPHVRGEHTVGSSRVATSAGSSPRAWGTQ